MIGSKRFVCLALVLLVALCQLSSAKILSLRKAQARLNRMHNLHAEKQHKCSVAPPQIAIVEPKILPVIVPQAPAVAPSVPLVETNAQLQETLEKGGNVLVFFFTPFSKAAKAIDSDVANLAVNNLSSFKVVKVDISQKNGLGQSLGVNKVPAFHFYSNGALKKNLITAKFEEVSAGIKSQGWLA